jgi:hypothetical protein
MQTDDWTPPPFPRDALHVFAYLRRRGGSMRIGPLLRWAGLSGDDLVAALNALAERRWVEIAWRAPRDRLPAGLPERFREVERVTTTRFGRWRYPVTWQLD